MVISSKGDQYYYTFLFFFLTYHSVQKNVKNQKHSKVRHSKKPDKDKRLYFKARINITLKNYSFIPKNCFKLLVCTQLMSDAGHFPQQNIFILAQTVIIRGLISIFYLTGRIITYNIIIVIHKGYYVLIHTVKL